MRMAHSPLSHTALLHPRPCLVLGQENGLSNGLHSSPFIGSHLFAFHSYARIPMEQNRRQLQSLTLALISFFPLSLHSAAARETSGRSPASNSGTVVSPFFFSSLAPLCAAEDRHRREPSQCQACPPVGGRDDIELLLGVVNWLGFFLDRRRPEPIFFPHGMSTTDTWSGPTS
jgi:hypothetical protein